jgi:hypothetical protein
LRSRFADADYHAATDDLGNISTDVLANSTRSVRGANVVDNGWS